MSAMLVASLVVACSGNQPPAAAATPQADAKAPRLAQVAADEAEARAYDNLKLERPSLNGDRTLSAQDRAKCVAAGGFVRREGMMQVEACLRRFRDGGKSCGDGSECLSKECLYQPSLPLESKRGRSASGSSTGLRGVCASDNSGFGCKQFVKEGKLTGGLCVD
jgi:hypothetical protein